ncbi:MAG: hypothetical protein LBJ12_08880 [Oscillospiraceae bacterium]|jgi:AbrB family looped-hinge helix DNA binding protein|nr:hypothetical protein [Oscillospiraceae bacterium]
MIFGNYRKKDLTVDTEKRRGVVRSVDRLGRYSIVSEMRETLGIKGGDLLELYLLEDGSMLLVPRERSEKKYEDADRNQTAWQ